jgi:hypothetical protein
LKHRGFNHSRNCCTTLVQQRILIARHVGTATINFHAKSPQQEHSTSHHINSLFIKQRYSQEAAAQDSKLQQKEHTGTSKKTMAKGSSSNNAAAVFGTAVAIRLALFQFPALASLLGERVEISTPVTSFKRRMLNTCCSIEL